jgi:hypothetical protein
MAETNPTDHCFGDHLYPAAAEDAKVEQAVLSFLLDQHPDRLTILELSLALNAGPTDFDSEDAVERAVRELVGAGLLHCHGRFVMPTRAALYFSRLVID